MMLDQALSTIQRKAESGLNNVYRDLRREIQTEPGAVPASERYTMNAFFLSLKADARALIIDALEQDGKESSALVWINSIEPKLPKPRFEFLQVADVYANIPSGAPGKSASHGSSASSSSKASPQLTGKVLGTAAVSAAVGAALKLGGAAAKGSLIGGMMSGAGTLFIVAAAAIGGVVIYSINKNSSSQRSSYSNTEKSGSFSSNISVQQVSVEKLIDSQLAKNRSVLNKWLDTLEHAAREAAK